MGGCKCSFRDCNNSTERMPGMSFFHYPYKEPTRFELWLSFAHKPSFRHLDIKAIRNKVVCSDHFRDENFMNYQKNKLTKTAYPTLGRYRFNRILVLDFEKSENPCVETLPKPTLPHLIPPPEYETPSWSPFYLNGVDSNSYDEEDDTLSKDEEVSIVVKNSKSEEEDEDITEIDGGHFQTFTRKTFKQLKSPQKLKMIDLKGLKLKKEYEIEDASNMVESQVPSSNQSPMKYPPQKKRKVMVKRVTKVLNNISTTTAKPEDVFHIPVSEILNSSSEMISFSEKEAIEFRENHTQTTPDRNSLPDHDKLLLKQQAKFESKIKELEAALEKKDTELNVLRQATGEEKSELNAKISKLESQLKESNSSSSKPGILSKAQLYNGLKKYLCPAMATLVRMEMFGGAEREWKQDEKIASVDLLKLGDGVFNYFRDEWRIHLPAKKDVKEWADNGDQLDDEDL